MKNLPVAVKDEDIEEMFEFADKDKDGNLSYAEFLVRLWLSMAAQYWGVWVTLPHEGEIY